MEAFCAAKGMESPFAGGRPGQGVPKGPKACPLTRALGAAPHVSTKSARDARAASKGGQSGPGSRGAMLSFGGAKRGLDNI